MLSIHLDYEIGGFNLQVSADCSYPVTAVFGPSGSGKTTLLNLVAGLLRPKNGLISVGGEVLFSSEKGIDLPPEHRRIGYVFQEDLLFPHLSILRNLQFGYDFLPVEDRKFSLCQISELLSLNSLLDRKPNQLSGGERQRVALGRAILSSPMLLVMDEPLASLDQSLKDRIIPYLRHIRTDLGIPMLYVSHSVAEILQLTGQVLVLKEGRLIAHGDFFHLAHQPDVLPILEAHGFENVLPVTVINPSGTRVSFGEHELRIPPCDRTQGSRIFVGIRANDIILCRTRPSGLSIRNAITGKILEISDTDGKHLVYVDIGKRLAVEVTGEAVDELELKPGDPVVCLIKAHSIRIGPNVD